MRRTSALVVGTLALSPVTGVATQGGSHGVADRPWRTRDRAAANAARHGHSQKCHNCPESYPLTSERMLARHA